MKIANWYKNCKLIWKLQTSTLELYTETWELQTDMKTANWYENCKAILKFWCIVPMWTFAIFIWDTAGMKTCSETERMFPLNCGVDDKNSTKWSLANPSTIHIYLIPIPMRTHLIHILSHDSSALYVFCSCSFILSVVNCFCSCTIFSFAFLVFYHHDNFFLINYTHATFFVNVCATRGSISMSKYAHDPYLS